MWVPFSWSSSFGLPQMRHVVPLTCHCVLLRLAGCGPLFSAVSRRRWSHSSSNCFSFSYLFTPASCPSASFHFPWLSRRVSFTTRALLLMSWRNWEFLLRTSRRTEQYIFGLLSICTSHWFQEPICRVLMSHACGNWLVRFSWKSFSKLGREPWGVLCCLSACCSAQYTLPASPGKPWRSSHSLSAILGNLSSQSSLSQRSLRGPPLCGHGRLP
mmetsp:Transcript_117652/g.333433  ORF Transcript_117652/g.333433 Transcript_117652/m.333433 type:complete len:214 (-) Transcript_117652:167-808(-)